jgi:hypothetical protein
MVQRSRSDLLFYDPFQGKFCQLLFLLNLVGPANFGRSLVNIYGEPSQVDKNLKGKFFLLLFRNESGAFMKDDISNIVKCSWPLRFLPGEEPKEVAKRAPPYIHDLSIKNREKFCADFGPYPQ